MATKKRPAGKPGLKKKTLKELTADVKRLRGYSDEKLVALEGKLDACNAILLDNQRKLEQTLVNLKGLNSAFIDLLIEKGVASAEEFEAAARREAEERQAALEEAQRKQEEAAAELAELKEKLAEEGADGSFLESIEPGEDVKVFGGVGAG